MPSSKPSRDQQRTVSALLNAAGRRKPEVPLRRDFVQQGPQREPRPGPLSDMVRHHDERAFDLYLLARAAASAEPWDVKRPAPVWGRAIGLVTDKDSGRAAVSRTWARLESTYGLVRRERSGQLARVFMLHEAGNREPYTYPHEGYFKLPFAFWTDEQAWYVSLSFAAKATLLIALSLRPSFALPAERAPAWYGLSADTVDRGLRELRRTGLLTRTFKEVENWLSPTGKTTQYRFSLQPPFDRKSADRSPLRTVSA